MVIRNVDEHPIRTTRHRRPCAKFNAIQLLTILALVCVACRPSPVRVGVMDQQALADIDRYDDRPWATVLQEYVKEGLVDYDRLAKHREPLLDYLKIIAATSPDQTPDQFPTPESRLAFYANAYNAGVVAAVLEAGVPETVHSFQFRPFEQRNRLLVGRRSLTLDELRRRAVAAAAGDARVIFTFCDAAVGSPPLMEQPLRAGDLDAQLDSIAEAAMDSQSVVSVDHENQALKVATWMLANREMFFDYYRRQTGADEVTMLNVVLRFARRVRRDWLNTAVGYPVRMIPYDRRLNRTTQQAG